MTWLVSWTLHIISGRKVRGVAGGRRGSSSQQALCYDSYQHQIGFTQSSGRSGSRCVAVHHGNGLRAGTSKALVDRRLLSATSHTQILNVTSLRDTGAEIHQFLPFSHLKQCFLWIHQQLGPHRRLDRAPERSLPPLGSTSATMMDENHLNLFLWWEINQQVFPLKNITTTEGIMIILLRCCRKQRKHWEKVSDWHLQKIVQSNIPVPPVSSDKTLIGVVKCRILNLF